MELPSIYYNNRSGVLELHANIHMNLGSKVFEVFDQLYEMTVIENVDNDFNSLFTLLKQLIESVFVYSTSHHYYANNKIIYYYKPTCSSVYKLLRENTSFMNKMYLRKKRLYIAWTLALLDKKFGFNISNVIAIYTYPRTYLKSKRFHQIYKWCKPFSIDHSTAITNYQEIKDTLKNVYGIIPALSKGID